MKFKVGDHIQKILGGHVFLGKIIKKSEIPGTRTSYYVKLSNDVKTIFCDLKKGKTILLNDEFMNLDQYSQNCQTIKQLLNIKE